MKTHQENEEFKRASTLDECLQSRKEILSNHLNFSKGIAQLLSGQDLRLIKVYIENKFEKIPIPLIKQDKSNNRRPVDESYIP